MDKGNIGKRPEGPCEPEGKGENGEMQRNGGAPGGETEVYPKGVGNMGDKVRRGFTSKTSDPLDELALWFPLLSMNGSLCKNRKQEMRSTASPPNLYPLFPLFK